VAFVTIVDSRCGLLVLNPFANALAFRTNKPPGIKQLRSISERSVMAGLTSPTILSPHAVSATGIGTEPRIHKRQIST
jgi:hypothetical protein